MSTDLNNARLESRALTPIGEAWIDGGVLWHRINHDTEVTERNAAATVEALGTLVGAQPIPAVVDIRGVTFADRAARDVFAREANHEVATALIVASRMSQALGNAYLRLSRPDRPTRMFTSAATARSWALAFTSSPRGPTA